ncbi:hypothetical protein KL86DYS1_20196 [uncultured Dysgonomonas sp.]|uniref:Uncharacterized protein n=1 Tax=uncultured Dysgonomonas sp. TaxID=206096 RepID=A0A212JLZ1_9BACT|nr:hypothetical protein [uncultured Dysgonomonas sp.]SBW00447.1 hypothetical protein KL86DYS1_20196 [uncultured Dysgonomonas sp.]
MDAIKMDALGAVFDDIAAKDITHDHYVHEKLLNNQHPLFQYLIAEH